VRPGTLPNDPKNSMRFLLFILLFFYLSSCETDVDKKREEHKQDARSFKPIEQDAGNCGLSDGEHEAEVEYTNPNTNYSKEYTLNIQVENCQVVEIDFPKGGWLDMHHIEPTEIDENGDASLTDDKGREWSIHFDTDQKDDDSDDGSDRETDSDD
jgi:hypothetical protein